MKTSKKTTQQSPEPQARKNIGVKIIYEGVLLLLITVFTQDRRSSVPMPGDSGSNPDAGSISRYRLTKEIFNPTPAYCCPSISLKQCFGQ
jgi:hypothetical protein